MKEEIFKYGLGCVPSVMDGTEHNLEVDDKLTVPSAYDLRKVMPPVRNQGSASTCVCQSLTGILDYQKNSREGISNVCNGFSIDELYDIRSNKPANGMTFKEALHYLKHHGLNGEKINGYAKVNSVEAVKYALLMFGPVTCGFPVYSKAGNQFWLPIGYNQGGHAVTIVGYTENSFIIRNSWGTEWSNKGHVEMPFDDFNKYCFEAWTIII